MELLDIIILGMVTGWLIAMLYNEPEQKPPKDEVLEDFNEDV